MSAVALSSTPARANGRRVVVLIATLLALPFVIAALLWQFGWQPARQMNHGELLASAERPLLQLHESDLSRWDVLTSSAGDSLRSQKIPGNATSETRGAENAILGHWLLALIVPGECGADCLAQLHLARQVQISLNKDMGRLKRALIGPQLKDAAALATTQSRWPDLLIARPGPAGWQTLGGAAMAAPQLLLIDPQGRLVLRYPPSPDARGLRRDIERLLKYSWNG